uniref:Uncharacterized protein n=1 Tax=Siphoviridae sp. ctOCb13 TaxID=2825477 RepID=A0A8S5Q040_9CAUD|nr:MAG TPA: hypothetical protein [Siphoviridae sp. ctOCb13]
MSLDGFCSIVNQHQNRNEKNILHYERALESSDAHIFSMDYGYWNQCCRYRTCYTDVIDFWRSNYPRMVGNNISISYWHRCRHDCYGKIHSKALIKYNGTISGPKRTKHL